MGSQTREDSLGSRTDGTPDGRNFDRLFVPVVGEKGRLGSGEDTLWVTSRPVLQRKRTCEKRGGGSKTQEPEWGLNR